LPRASPEALLDHVLDGVGPRDERELHGREGWSRLFEERQGALLTSQLFPHQRAQDPVLYTATVAKRLERAAPGENLRDYQAKGLQASMLFGALLRVAQLPTEPEAFDPELFAHCVYETEFVKLTKKTRAALANNANRARPDWAFHFVDHFIKSQVKAKAEVLAQPGKPGQTLATCSDLVVLLFGPVVRYLRHKVMDRLPDNIFCNCGKSIADQGAWARRHWRDVRSTTSDYTGFDSTQRGDSLGLEYRLMRHFNIPEAWVLGFDMFRATDLGELYLDWKLNIISSAVGPKRTGRDTGEPGTYDFNTYFGLALYQLMYSPPAGLACCVGGDDLAANAVLTASGFWRRFGSRFEIIARVEHTDRPEFCGFYLTAVGCYRNPKLLALKTLWHLDKGDAAAVDVNYAAEAATCYALGDSLASYCSWEDLECLGWLIEYYHQHRPALARHFFSDGGGQLPDTPLGEVYEDFQLEDAIVARRTLRAARGANRLAERWAAIKGLN
jgi:hypothetical protein